VILSGNRQIHPFFLRDEDFFHIGIFGQTGRGKTNAMLHILQVLKSHNIPWLVFDWKRTGYRDLLAEHNAQVFTVGRDISPLYFNPLVPPEGVDTITWYKQFIQCISHAYFLGHGCEMILQDVIGDSETLMDILKKLQVYPAKWRKLQWLQSTERAVKALCYGGISKVLNANVCQPITQWLDRNIVLELDALAESEAKFLVNIIMSQIYFYRKEQRHSGLRHVSIIEEAHNVLKKETENVEAKSVMDRIFREIREYGESIVFIDQMPSAILDSAFANTATQITFSLRYGKDVQAAGLGMLMDKDEQLLLGKLPVGTAVVKLQNRWHSPFMVKLPYVPIKAGKITDEVLKDKMPGYLPENKPICPEIPRTVPVPVISDGDKEGKRLLASIVEYPLMGIAERYLRIQLNPKIGNECKEKLIKDGYVREVTIKSAKGRIKLMELTQKGKQKAEELGLEVSDSGRNGGVEHLYWVMKAKEVMTDNGYEVKEEYPMGNGKTVDLAIPDKKIAIEIETGKSDAMENIRKCLKAGFGIISAGTNMKAYFGIQQEIKELSEADRQRVRVVTVWGLGRK